LNVLEETSGVAIYGIKDARRLEERVPPTGINFGLVHYKTVEVNRRFGEALSDQ